MKRLEQCFLIELIDVSIQRDIELVKRINLKAIVTCRAQRIARTYIKRDRKSAGLLKGWVKTVVILSTERQNRETIRRNVAIGEQ